MALIFWDGFDSYNSFENIAAARPTISMGAYPGRNACYLISGYGRFGGGAIMGGGSATGYLDISASAASEIYTGRAINTDVRNMFMHTYEQNDNGGSYPTPAVTVEHAGSGQIKIWRGKGIDGYGTDVNKVLIGQSEIGMFPINAWNWVEMRLKMSSSSSTADGIVEFWINNKKVISNTACVTKNYSSTYYKGIGICMEFWNGNFYGPTNATDDIYVLDTTGSAPYNTRLGDSRIINLPVISDSGPNSGTVANGSPHYMWVNDAVGWNNNYVSMGITGNSEIYSVNSLASNTTSQIYAVAVTSIAEKSDAGNCVVHNVIVSNGTTYSGNSTSLSTSFTWNRTEYLSNPNTGTQWTAAQVSNTKIGLVVE